MPLQTVDVKFQGPGVDAVMSLTLDDQKFTQKLIMDFLKHQQLYESKIAQLIMRVMRPGDVFVDCGGHIGYFSLIASLCTGPTGKVFVFEPEQENYQHILRHIAQNRLSNLFPFPWAVAARTGVLTLFLSNNDGGHAIWDLRKGPYDAERAEIPQRPTFGVALDDLRGLLTPAPKFIKIDVEGAEMEVLRGASRLLAERSVPIVVCECHRTFLQCVGTSEHAMRAYMAEFGYEAYADLGHETQFVQLPPGAELQTKFVFNIVFAQPGALSGG